MTKEQIYGEALYRIANRLSGIDQDDLTTAEKQIKKIVEKALEDANEVR